MINKITIDQVGHHMAETFQDYLKYCRPKRKWIARTNGVWSVDCGEARMRRCKEILMALDLEKRFGSWNSLQRIIRHAKAELGTSYTPEELNQRKGFDGHIVWLGCPYNLKLHKEQVVGYPENGTTRGDYLYHLSRIGRCIVWRNKTVKERIQDRKVTK